jgi:hypothetical protein
VSERKRKRVRGVFDLIFPFQDFLLPKNKIKKATRFSPFFLPLRSIIPERIVWTPSRVHACVCVGISYLGSLFLSFLPFVGGLTVCLSVCLS